MERLRLSDGGCLCVNCLDMERWCLSVVDGCREGASWAFCTGLRNLGWLFSERLVDRFR